MTERMPERIMLDTNVLLDYLLRRADGGHTASQVVSLGTERGLTLLCASLSLKDVAYITGMMVRRRFRPGESELENVTARMLARELPWKCVRRLLTLCEVVDVDGETCETAASLRDRHDDFEDDLIVAAAQQADADCVVTMDREMAAHFPDYCIGPQKLLSRLAPTAA